MRRRRYPYTNFLVFATLLIVLAIHALPPMPYLEVIH